MYQHIKQSIQDGIAQIVMDRPASNNALDAQMFRDLIAAVEHCDADEAVKVIILTGAGKNFSAGGDIKEMATFEFISYELSMLTGQASLALRTIFHLRQCRRYDKPPKTIHNHDHPSNGWFARPYKGIIPASV